MVSSGTLFDSTFMRYQIAERTRLAQITCEIFVNEGLDSALNIDRESFNNAHPHSVYLTKWLHGALRQLATAQKKLASEIRNQARDEQKGVIVSDIQQIAIEAWTQESGDQYTAPPDRHAIQRAGAQSYRRGIRIQAFGDRARTHGRQYGEAARAGSYP